jgi:predicted DNA-binding protein
MKDLHVHIPDETQKQLTELAKVFKQSKTKTIRHLIEKEYYILCTKKKK